MYDLFPKHATRILNDIYYFMMEIRWPSFFLAVLVIFFLINLMFGCAYALMPGAISNMARGSIVEGLLFSIDTFGNIGYGQMIPVTYLGHAVAATEVFAGIFFSGTMTGLIFARLSRPRQSIVFSRFAVIGRYKERPTLKIRLAPLRPDTLIGIQAQLFLRSLETLADGRTLQRSVALERHSDRNPFLGLAWTLGHAVDDGSAVAEALAHGRDVSLVVVVSGNDLILATKSFGSRTYRAMDILRDHEYGDMIGIRGGAEVADLGRIDDVIPIRAVR